MVWATKSHNFTVIPPNWRFVESTNSVKFKSFWIVSMDYGEKKKGISGYSFLYAATMFSPPCLDNKTCEWEFIIFTPFCGLGLFQEEYKLIIYGCNVLYLSVRPPFWNCEKNLSVPISKFFRLGFVLLGKNDLSDAALRKKTYNRLTQPSDWRSM